MEKTAEIYYNLVLTQMKEAGTRSEYHRLYTIIMEKCPEEFKAIFILFGLSDPTIPTNSNTNS